MHSTSIRSYLSRPCLVNIIFLIIIITICRENGCWSGRWWNTNSPAGDSLWSHHPLAKPSPSLGTRAWQYILHNILFIYLYNIIRRLIMKPSPFTLGTTASLYFLLHSLFFSNPHYEAITLWQNPAPHNMLSIYIYHIVLYPILHYSLCKFPSNMRPSQGRGNRFCTALYSFQTLIIKPSSSVVA